MKSSHHDVDLLDSQAQTAGLKTCGEVGLHHCLEIDPLVKVVASDLQHGLWEVAAGLKDSLKSNRRSVVCHLFCKNRGVSAVVPSQALIKLKH